ncbi:Protein of unknown function [Streptomyces sp. cf386]|uniref:DUF4231 domain-containing protein n=1 Tax=Streptomyces sp. cf386 TaxID=1761904 RepID=UPI0008887B65|nr:DUF4231 domain-containing protein [Streptomyces sp. cf386]SDM35549.1 Protein of unknown function [Streptomyces sp. cf386]
MSTGGGGAAAREVWRVQSIWSQAAARRRTGIARARAATLCAGVGAGVLGAAAAQLMPLSPPAGRTFAFLALLAAGSAPLTALGASPDRVRQWTRLRSVSEELKSQVYVYLAGLAQYRQSARRDAELLDRTGAVLAEIADLESETHGIRPADRPLPPVTDTVGYVEQRLRHQLESYYRPKADEMAGRARLVERCGQALAALSVLLGAAAGAFEAQAAAVWIPVVAAVTVAVVSHGASARYVSQQIEYSMTAGELERLLRWWQQRAPATDADADRLAERTEHIVSVQNEGWMAKWIAD